MSRSGTASGAHPELQGLLDWAVAAGCDVTGHSSVMVSGGQLAASGGKCDVMSSSEVVNGSQSTASDKRGESIEATLSLETVGK